MNHLVKKYSSGNRILEIYLDEYAENPRDWNNLGTIVYYHKDYILGDQKMSYEDMEYYIKTQFLAIPIYAYEHGQISIKAIPGNNPTYPFNDRWDSYFVGFICMSKAKIIQEYGSLDDLTPIVQNLINEVQTFNDYLNGNCYRYEIKEPHKCDLGENHYELIDSCSGFIGDYEDILKEWNENKWTEIKE